MDSTQSILVADIGGTNARFAVVEDVYRFPQVLSHLRTYACENYQKFESVLSAYKAEISDRFPTIASFAVAAPINNDLISLTNLDWEFSIAKVEKVFEFQRVHIINDFAAQALATTQLKINDLEIIRDGVAKVGAPRAIIGPGTGLGTAGLVWTGDRWQTISGEGGHMSFLPSNATERVVYDEMLKRFSHVCYEDLLSGSGLLNIYHALNKGGVSSENLSVKDIVSFSSSVEKSVAIQSIQIFIELLGRVAGELALAYGALGGVYLSGGMTRLLRDFIPNSGLVQCFLNCRFRKEYLKNVPIFAVLHPYAGLLGAGYAYLQFANKKIEC